MKNKTASVLIIGNEILSGKTQDKNLSYIAGKLANMGISFVEARVVRDTTDEIVAALNELRKKYDYVFTTGGIGPTHDDITIDAVAKAFGVKVRMDPRAKAKLEEYYKSRGRANELNEARLKMAQFPEGAELIENPLTSAPGCKMENVFVLAGIPSIMQVMFDHASEQLQKGSRISSESISCDIVEGDLASQLTKIQNDNTNTEIGSYPYVFESKYATSLVVRSTDVAAIKKAAGEIRKMIAGLGGRILENQ